MSDTTGTHSATKTDAPVTGEAPRRTLTRQQVLAMIAGDSASTEARGAITARLRPHAG